MRIHGRCHCGAIRFEAEVALGTVAVCHCSDCQTFSGGAYRAMVRPDPQDSLELSGSPKHYAKTADSGRQRMQGFCGECGAQLYSVDPDGANLALRIGAIAERHQLGEPARQFWCDSAFGWAFDLSGVPRSAKQG